LFSNLRSQIFCYVGA